MLLSNFFSRNVENNNEEILKLFFKEKLIENISFMAIKDIEDDVTKIVNKIWEDKDPSLNASLLIKQKYNLNVFKTNMAKCKKAILEAMKEVKNEQKHETETIKYYL